MSGCLACDRGLSQWPSNALGSGHFDTNVDVTTFVVILCIKFELKVIVDVKEDVIVFVIVVRGKAQAALPMALI